MSHSHGVLHHFAHHFDRAFEDEVFARADIQLQGDDIQSLLAIHRQVRALGQILANQSVDIEGTAIRLLPRCQEAVLFTEIKSRPRPAG